MSADSSFPGFAAPAAGFEAPLEMLAACHGRIEQQCATLGRLMHHLAAHGPDAQAQTAAAAILRYFDSAAPAHHADEEQDLFPALVDAMAGSDAVCIHHLIARLAAEHRVLEESWARLRPALIAVVGGTTVSGLAAAAAEFRGLYALHLAVEEAELLPLAARLIGDAELDRIGRAMRLRRGVSKV
jgi:hemerythrin-like domain-containing protein